MDKNCSKATHSFQICNGEPADKKEKKIADGEDSYQIAWMHWIRSNEQLTRDETEVGRMLGCAGGVGGEVLERLVVREPTYYE